MENHLEIHRLFTRTDATLATFHEILASRARGFPYAIVNQGEKFIFPAATTVGH